MPHSLQRAQSLYRVDRLDRSEEHVETLLETKAFRLERLVSFGSVSPPGFWYDQKRPEWVLLASGTATLSFEGATSQRLQAGDHLLIPAGLRHRVESTSNDAVWVALHFESNS